MRFTVPFSSVSDAIGETVTSAVVSGMKPNALGEFNFGSLNNEKSLNTTVYKNGNPTLQLNSNGTITYRLPIKVEGDHKVWFLFGGWKQVGRVCVATASLQVVLSLSVTGAGGPLSGLNLDVAANASVAGFQSHINYPLGGIVAIVSIIGGLIGGPALASLIYGSLTHHIHSKVHEIIAQATNYRQNISHNVNAASVAQQAQGHILGSIAISSAVLTTDGTNIYIDVTFG